MKRLLLLILIALVTQGHAQFAITASPKLEIPAGPGRLFIYLTKSATVEPRSSINTDNIPQSGTVFAKDVYWKKGQAITIDASAANPGRSFTTVSDMKHVEQIPAAGQLISFPASSLSALDTGTWYAQALYDFDTLYFSNDAPGNVYSDPVKIRLPLAAGHSATLLLKNRFKADTFAEDQYVRHVRIKSELLSNFWKRPMFVDAGVLLPEGFDSSGKTTYPVRYRVGGYGSHWTRISRYLQNPANRKMWTDPNSPKMIQVFLDCEAPYGDSYQMNSENNGPYNDVLTTELIPYIEKRFNATGTPQSRFVDGGSTGGWVSLALQVFNPDFFNGCWSFYGDPVDFRFFQLVNIYRDKNAFVNRFGNDNPSVRTTHGEPVLSIRNEVLYEAVLGRGNNFITSGGQWGGWNAVYSPKGADGKPRSIWNSFTGVIDSSVAIYWKDHWDLRFYLEKNWSTLGPKLQDKLHIWMGDMDNYYLNEAMRMLQQYLSTTTAPKSNASFTFGPMMGHGWEPLSEEEKMRQMFERLR